MNITSAYMITILFYLISVSSIYTTLFPIKTWVRHPFVTLTLILLVNELLSYWNPHLVFAYLDCSMILGLLFFQGKIAKRIAGFVAAYFFLLLNDVSGSTIARVLVYLLSGKAYYTLIKDDTPSWMLLVMTLSVVVFGIIFLKLYLLLLKNFSKFKNYGLLLNVSLPVLVSMLTSKILLYFSDSHIYLLIIFVSCIVFLICYIPVFFSFRKFYYQELEIQTKMKHMQYIDQQLYYSKQLEQQYRNLRKWNHDISNHLHSIDFLLQQERYNDTTQYLDQLLQSNSFDTFDNNKV